MERSALQRDYNSTLSQMNTCQAQSRSIEEQLEFVRRKKSELGNLKDEIRENREKAQRIDMGIMVTDWRGQNYGTFHDAYVYDLRSEEHTSELQSRGHLVCRLLLEKR